MKKSKIILYVIIGVLALALCASVLNVRYPGSDKVDNIIDGINDKLEDIGDKIDDIFKPDEEKDFSSYSNRHWKFKDEIKLSDVKAWVDAGNPTELYFSYITSSTVSSSLDGNLSALDESTGIYIEYKKSTANSLPTYTFYAFCEGADATDFPFITYDVTTGGYITNSLGSYHPDYTFYVESVVNENTAKFLDTFCEPYSYIGTKLVSKTFSSLYYPMFKAGCRQYGVLGEDGLSWDIRINGSYEHENFYKEGELIVGVALDVNSDGTYGDVDIFYGLPEANYYSCYFINPDSADPYGPTDFVITLTEEPTGEELRLITAVLDVCE